MNQLYKMLLRGIVSGKIKIWDGGNIDVHLCASRQIHDDDFEAICAVCKKTAYYHDWSGAKVYVHLECLPQVPTDEKEFEVWVKTL